MKRNKFLEFIGFKYIVNNNTGEIHRVETLSKACRISMMTNARYISRRKARKLIKKGHDGCRFCYPEKDNG